MKFRFLHQVFLIIALAACAQVETQTPPSFTPISPTVELTPIIPTSSPAFTITAPASPSPIPSHTPNPLPTTDLSASLALEGPWLVYVNGDDQLTIVNQDGTGLKHLMISPYPPYFRFRRFSSTGVLAVMTQIDQDIVIALVDLPDGEILRTIPLLSYYKNHEQSVMDDGPEGPSGGVLSSPTWSHDGRYLAFMGAIDGPSSDLYVYDAFDDTLKRLTYGENQAATPIWSPDDKWIIHEEITNFHGWSTAGIWASSIDGSVVKLLYRPVNNIEQSLSWAGNDTFIATDYGMDAQRNIRIVNVETGNITTLFEGYFWDASFDSQSGALAVIPIQGAPGVGPEMDAYGIYLISRLGATPVLIVPDAREIYRPIDDYFFSDIECGDRMFVVFTASGDKDCLFYTPLNTSHDGLWSVSSDNGLSLFDRNGKLVSNSPDAEFESVRWAPDSLGFFMEADGFLYYVSVPDFDFQVVEESSDFQNFMWVNLQ